MWEAIVWAIASDAEAYERQEEADGLFYLTDARPSRRVRDGAEDREVSAAQPNHTGHSGEEAA
jgi:hypothetical protein